MSANTAQRQAFPLTVKRGSSVVKIYKDAKATGTYYRVTYHLGGKRHRMNFADLAKATAEAEAKASQLSRGDVDAMQLSGRDRLVYSRAVDAIRPTGAALDSAAIEYAQAHKALDGLPLLDAVRFYVRHQGRGITRKAVADGVSEMIAAKKRDGASTVYLADLRYRLGVFADRFHCDLVALTRDDVRSFFDDLELSPRSFNNFLGALKTFFAFSGGRAWLSEEADLLASVKRRKEKKLPVEIFSPEQIGELLKHAPRALAHCFALGAFAGLRTEEILRLEWADLTRRPGFVEVAAEKAKTAARRLVPISDNLAHWLAISGARDKKLVWPHTKATFFRNRLAIATEAGVPYKPNALRHSWISYRLAETQDMNRVALEAGNSPQMINRHYRELVTPEQARSWFSIAPDVAANVVPMAGRKAV